MGLDIERDRFEELEYLEFSRKLHTGLEALQHLLQRPGFGEGRRSLGVEVEVALVDRQGFPHPINHEVLAHITDPRVTLELVRFNIEFNTNPIKFAGRPFSSMGTQCAEVLETVSRAAKKFDSRIALVGILPTLGEHHLGPDSMSDAPRYRALSNGLRRLRGPDPFHISIQGRDGQLELLSEDMTLEGANTALQIHLRVGPKEFRRHYNAAQMAIAPVLAASVNSPFFLAQQLWQETRIPLFAQAVDSRVEELTDWRMPARVSFGNGWVRKGVFELFEEIVALHPPLLPVISEEDPLAVVRAGGVPQLFELNMHNGTVWRWNRPVYDTASGGQLRIEMRALPAGPTEVDMMANMAFMVGLTLGLAPMADKMIVALPFQYAARNFHHAARRGLDADFLWPADGAPSPRLRSAVELIEMLLPVAKAGLVDGGVDEDEADYYLGIVEERLSGKMTGARWQIDTLMQLERRFHRDEALFLLLEHYLRLQETGEPVARWPIPRI